MMTMSPAQSSGAGTLVTQASNQSPFIGQLKTIGATMPVMRGPATSLVVLPCGCGCAKPTRRRSPLWQQRQLRVMFVAVEGNRLRLQLRFPR